MIGSGTIDGNGKDTSLHGVIGGPGEVTFNNSSNKITLNAVCTYTGSTTINSGVTLCANRANAIAASSSVAVNGTFDLNQYPQLLNNVTGNGTIKDNGENSALTLNTTSGCSFEGTLDSSLGGVTVVGPGVLTLSGTNGTTNGLSIGGILNGIAVGGILNISDATNLGGGPIYFNEGGILQAGTVVSLSQSVTLNGNAIIDCGGHNVGISGDVTGNSFCISAIGSGTLTLPSGYGGTVRYSGTNVNNASSPSELSASPNNTSKGDTILPSSTTISASGSTAFSTGTVFFYGDASSKIQANGDDLTIPNPISLVTQGTLDANSHALTVTGPIAGSTGLTVHTTTGSTGTVALLGNNSYTGGTTVNSGVLLKIYDPMNVGIGTVTIQSGGAIQAVGNVTITRPLVFH
jgi:fibronectin-binding autotransporter adhesin